MKGAKAGWKAGRRLESLPHIGHDTENTEKNRPRRTRRWEERGADTLGGIYAARRVEVEHAVVRATPPVLAAVGDWNSRTVRDCVALPA